MARRDDIERLQGEVEELFADLWQIPRFAGLRQGFRPQVDCFRTDDPPELTVLVELPGADEASVQIVLDGRRLTITGERPRPRGGISVWYRSEIEYGPFRREIGLNEDVQPDRARAVYEHGLLRITLPVAVRPPTTARVPIEVKSAQ